MRDHRGRRQAAQPTQSAQPTSSPQVRAQPVRVTVEDEDDIRSQFSRLCSVRAGRRRSSNSPRISISGDSGELRFLASSSDEDDVITDDCRYSLVPLYESFI